MIRWHGAEQKTKNGMNGNPMREMTKKRRTVDERQSRPLIERPFASWDEARPTQRLTTAVYRSPGYPDLAPRRMHVSTAL